MKKTGYCNYSNIFSYYYNSVKSTGVWNVILKATKLTKSYFIISKIIKYAAVVIAFIETSAALIIVSTVFLVFVPIFIVSTAATYFASIVHYRKTTPIIKEVIDDSEKIVFIDAQKGYFNKKATYLKNMAIQFKDEGYTVFIVSHPLFRDRFVSARKVEDKIWIVKINYYFTLKRKVLDDCEKPMTYVY